MSGEQLVKVSFEVFGRGVSFRYYTSEEANRRGLCGWVENTPRGTVQGEIEGPLEQVRGMKRWLESTGSPYSRIERAEFGPEVAVVRNTLQPFDILR
ncbi:hypothetical protein HYH03_005270 [Edaphochlamys debaryana]|uniref:acylphosphatase n=1 Tax=Edaphochlamys debaryana TaxID=47281 RepID=A0A836C1L2_9CHLO|nr:hypothetical protein HYH03_005270 [Edaphochlamys debaryana]|eukprot:KAG2496870.1 hypothetical protein HYH03_005270 [Edaphochlamys debaryana]